MPQRILVIKHGALGDFVLATGPFTAIRRAHRDDHITLLTTNGFVAPARQSDYFDEIWVDRKPAIHQIGAWLALGSKLRRGGFKRVYDLQTSGRSSLYFRLFGRRKPEWSGIARGCSHPHSNPARNDMHTLERQAEQLAAAGIGDVPGPDVSWLDGDLSGFALDDRFALIVPGGATHRPAKRWPGARYATLAHHLADSGIQPVLIGTANDGPVLDEIAGACSAALNLVDRTGLAEIAALARRAALAVGNDTGPMHLITAAGCRALVLFSHESDPVLSAPRGRQVDILRRPSLHSLDADEVIEAARVSLGAKTSSQLDDPLTHAAAP